MLNWDEIGVLEWGSERVRQWLDEIQLGEYRKAFEQNHITGVDLCYLTAEQIKNDLGISSLGHRRIIESEIEKLKEPAKITIDYSKLDPIDWLEYIFKTMH